MQIACYTKLVQIMTYVVYLAACIQREEHLSASRGFVIRDNRL